MQQDMVIFSRTFDLLEWLLPKSERFPRAYRSTVTLRNADAALGRLRVYLRLAHRWRWLSDGQYEHVGGMVAEIGRLLGGWLRSERA